MLEYWTYYPRSQTDHLPVARPAGVPSRRLGRAARGLLPPGDASRVRVAAPTSAGTVGAVVGGTARELGSLRRFAYRAAGSHALGSAAATSISRETAGTATSAWCPRVRATCVPRTARTQRARVRPGGRRALGQAGLGRSGRRHTGPPGSSPGAAARPRAPGAAVSSAARGGAAIARPRHVPALRVGSPGLDARIGRRHAAATTIAPEASHESAGSSASGAIR